MSAFDLSSSLREGISAAGSARDSIPSSWNDSWKNFSTQYALAEHANAHEIDMWNMQNAYNTPAAQMQRMKDAGLNPMLFYTQGNPGNSSSSPGTHMPNVQITPDKDKQAKLSTMLNVISTISGVINQAMGVIDQGLDTAMKANDLNFSNWQNSVASHHLLGYGMGRHAGQFGFLGSVESALDPSSSDFDPAVFNLLSRLGITQYYPRQMSAEASASLANEREKYQQWYNSKYAPLMEDLMSGRIEIQDYLKLQNSYETEMLTQLPPWLRGIVAPLLNYIRPFINTLLRNVNYGKTRKFK